MSEISVENLRSCLKKWPSGVVVVTSNYKDKLYGFSACSFVGVSLSPPLVSFCKDNLAMSLSAYVDGDFFGVSILSENQIDALKIFGSKSSNKFNELGVDNYIIAPNKSPLIKNAACHFECKRKYVYEGGDHKIIVGEVLYMQKNTTSSLVYNV